MEGQSPEINVTQESAAVKKEPQQGHGFPGFKDVSPVSDRAMQKIIREVGPNPRQYLKGLLWDEGLSLRQIGRNLGNRSHRYVKDTADKLGIPLPEGAGGWIDNKGDLRRSIRGMIESGDFSNLFSEREQKIIELRILGSGKPPSRSICGEAVGVSREIVRRVENRILDKVDKWEERKAEGFVSKRKAPIITEREREEDVLIKRFARARNDVPTIADLLNLSKFEVESRMDRLGIPVDLNDRDQYYNDLESDKK